MPAESPIFQFLALACLAPAIWFGYRDGAQARGYLGWLALAAAGPTLWCLAVLQDGWRVDFAFTVWVTAAATLLVFLAFALRSGAGQRLAVLVLPYLAVLIGFAALAGGGQRMLAAPPDAWVAAHIGLAVVTYALITLAAVAGFAVFLKERALKRRSPTRLAGMLPAVAEGERAQSRLLATGEGVLFVGLLTGIAIHVERGEALLEPDHKTLLTLAAFVVIGALLLVQQRSGMRGRRAAQVVLIAYLLVTLAWPGVKFVTDVLIG